MSESILVAIIIVGGVVALALLPAAFKAFRLFKYIAEPPPHPPLPEEWEDE